MLRRNVPPPLNSISSRPLSTDGLLKSPSLWCASAEPRSPGAISVASFMSSFSWVTEKSSGELASLLKNAYLSLREKERGNMSKRIAAAQFPLLAVVRLRSMSSNSHQST